MTVHVVSRRNGGNREQMVEGTVRLKQAWLRNGAETVRLDHITVGPDTDDWVVTLVFRDWSAFGLAMEKAAADPEMGAAVAGLNQVSSLVNRRLMNSQEL
jgi:hypothetical protein